MDKRLLVDRLERGMSLKQIAREVGRSPGTVGYWVRKHGLEANGRARYAPRGGIGRDDLEELIERGLTIEEIAVELGRGASTVNYWLRRHGLKTRRAHGRRPLALAALKAGQVSFVSRCSNHGETEFLVFKNGRSRCAKCNAEAVQRRRLRIKQILIDEAGRSCAICGYSTCPGALQFHHLDPSRKEFGLADGGMTRSLDRCRAEARKCVLLCANCHAEVEAGMATVS